MRINDNGIDRDMTASEIAAYEKAAAEALADEQTWQEAVAVAHAAKTSARAKLKALGLTEAEIAALVG